MNDNPLDLGKPSNELDGLPDDLIDLMKFLVDSIQAESNNIDMYKEVVIIRKIRGWQ